MGKEYANALYNSKKWQNCRNAYKKYRKGLCELCLEQGIIKPGEIVHHKRHVTAKSVDDPNTTLQWDNLQLLCREHHALVHEPDRKKKKRDQFRYDIDDYGHVIIKQKEK